MATRREIARVASALASAFAAAAILLPALSSAAPYQYPLNSTTIRDACLLGKESNNENTQTLALYSHALPNLTVHANVPAVTVVTPYLQVVERCAKAPDYNNQSAAQDFLGKPMTLMVRMDLYFSQALTNAGIDDSGEVRVHASNSAQDLKIVLSQNGEEVKPQSVRASAIFPPELDGFGIGQPVSIGQHVEIEVAPEGVQASELEIAIRMPDGSAAKTAFDLAKLK